MLLFVAILSLLAGMGVGTLAGVKIANHLLRDLRKAWSGQVQDFYKNSVQYIEKIVGDINPTVQKKLEESLSKVEDSLRDRLADKEILQVPDPVIIPAIKSLKECEDRLLMELQRSSIDINWHPNARLEFGEISTRAYAARRLLEEYKNLHYGSKPKVEQTPPNAPESKSSHRRIGVSTKRG